MTAIRQEVLDFINDIPDNKLMALKPILAVLVDDSISIETDLTDTEKQIILNGRAEYKNGGFTPLSDIQ